MNKLMKIITGMLIGSLLLAGTVTGCGTGSQAEDSRQQEQQGTDAPDKDQQESSQKPSNESGTDARELTPEEVENLLLEKIGTEDVETGNTYSFGYVQESEIDGTAYYIFMWSWLVDDHMSRITELAVKTDGSEAYEAMLDGENAEITGTENLLK